MLRDRRCRARLKQRSHTSTVPVCGKVLYSLMQQGGCRMHACLHAIMHMHRNSKSTLCVHSMCQKGERLVWHTWGCGGECAAYDAQLCIVHVE